MSALNLIDFFDEMQILSAEKEARISTARKLQDKVKGFFDEQLSDIEFGYFLTQTTSEDYKDKLAAIYMEFSDSEDDEYMQGRSKRFAEEVQRTTEKAVEKAKESQTFKESVEHGIPMRESDIPNGVKDALSDDRVLTIILNETNVIHNYKNHQELKETQNTHTWISMRDNRVRKHHKDADGQTVPIDEPFIVGGEKLMFPGDDSLGASARNILLCRCVEA